MPLRKKVYRSVLATVLFAGTVAPAFAETGFYLGATAGWSNFNENKSDDDAAITQAFNENGLTLTGAGFHSSLRKTDVAFVGLLGYRFTPAFSIEAAYIDLGKLSYKSSEVVTSPFFGVIPSSANLDASAKGPTLSALAILPLSPAWEIYGRAGVFFSKVTLDANASLVFASAQPGVPDGAGGGFDSVSANSVNPLVGVGAAWHMFERLSLRAEYTRFINVGDKDTTGQINIDLVNIGLTYSFR
jgi:opacity protein-like surface antigen